MAAMTPDAAGIEEVDARFCRALEGLDIYRIAGGARRIAGGARRIAGGARRIAGGATGTLGGRFELGLHQRRRPIRARAPSDPA